MFEIHNLHKESYESFAQNDPQLKALSGLPLVFFPPFLENFDPLESGIFTLTGGRQIGKSTAMKLWMKQILEAGFPPDSISYFTGEMISDHQALVRILENEITGKEGKPGPKVILVDEVTYIRDWDVGIKYLADAGHLAQVALILSGSDSVIIQDARKRFPGRRGTADQVDFHYHPLSFQQAVQLRKPALAQEIQQAKAEPQPGPKPYLDQLDTLFQDYLQHGGYLTAMNDLELWGEIKPATLATYSDWIRGDILKRNKSENRLREILKVVTDRLADQITWNKLASEMTIEHPATIISYAELLVSMDVLLVQAALKEDKLEPAPKKAKKIHFPDPFIFHAVNRWLQEQGPEASESAMEPALVEGVLAAHFSRIYPTYYIKAEGEVDIAYVRNRKFYPVEIKWRSQTRPKDLKQIVKYPNGEIWRRQQEPGVINGIPCKHLPDELYSLGAE